MFKKLVHDTKFEYTNAGHAIVASAETVTIQPGQVQVIHTGLYTYEPLALSFRKGDEKFGMCVLLTTALPAEQEVKVAILNRGTEPVTIVPRELLVLACRLGVNQPIDGSI